MSAKKSKKNKTTASSVCRVNKNANYTVMSNYHLRSTNLSLKAIGLLSKVLSLPENWDYSISGLTAICKEKETAIKAALDELKHWGYLVVTKLMPNETNSGRIEYVYDFYEYSEKDTPDADQNDDDTYDEDGDVSTISVKKSPQGAEKQGIENLPLEILPIEIQAVDNQGQINTKKKIKKNQILSDQVSINQSPSDSEKAVENVESQTDGLIDGYISEKEVYTDVVKTNIEFPYFAEWLGDEEEAEEIVQMIVRRICSRKKTERICGQDFPREVVKSAMLKVDINVLENAIEQMKRTDNVRNYESYLISTLFNEANGKRFKENAEGRWAEYAVKRDFGGYGG
ncbi:DUF6017 domain-containing protein [Ruminococcus albus]|uniref:DUF6017 domain-containing protein n=1 Tax=Ruminococcus albus TaxID=1264 RepID=A0A1I1FTD5_RUMAL|nr:DUF6017 domain-containing protein [Ruminococcus albus]SFC02829.1 hypothetical protein SAMN02910406_01018 [Ruminococcus albus]